MKKLFCLLLVMMLVPMPALAENPDTGSWGQINQAISRKEGWKQLATGDSFRLGKIRPL